MIGTIIEVTATLVMAYLIIANAEKFATAVSAGGEANTNAVVALQGR